MSESGSFMLNVQAFSSVTIVRYWHIKLSNFQYHTTILRQCVLSFALKWHTIIGQHLSVKRQYIYIIVWSEYISGTKHLYGFYLLLVRRNLCAQSRTVFHELRAEINNMVWFFVNWFCLRETYVRSKKCTPS